MGSSSSSSSRPAKRRRPTLTRSTATIPPTSPLSSSRSSSTRPLSIWQCITVPISIPRWLPLARFPGSSTTRRIELGPSDGRYGISRIVWVPAIPPPMAMPIPMNPPVPRRLGEMGPLRPVPTPMALPEAEASAVACPSASCGSRSWNARRCYPCCTSSRRSAGRLRPLTCWCSRSPRRLVGSGRPSPSLPTPSGPCSATTSLRFRRCIR
mmetsp:Transcript_7421/g.16534  ORF Transcript_7421/g.16534 Transcript_7421/m.16534 type:complete len:210 (-) Transcript_7421:6859-7488(-)